MESTDRERVFNGWVFAILFLAVSAATGILIVFPSLKPWPVIGGAMLVAVGIGNFVFWSIALAKNMNYR